MCHTAASHQGAMSQKRHSRHFKAPHQTLFCTSVLVSAPPAGAHRVLLMVSVLELTTWPSTISSTMVMIFRVVVEEVEVLEVVEMLKEQEAETRACKSVTRKICNFAEVSFPSTSVFVN